MTVRPSLASLIQTGWSNGGNHGAMQIGEENKGDVFMVPAKMQNDNLGENRCHMMWLFNLKMICKLCRVYISGSAKSSRFYTILVIDRMISRLKGF